MPVEKLLLRFTAFFWLLAKLISFKLWLADRLYPVVPPIELLEIKWAVVHKVLFFVSLAILFSIIVLKKVSHLLIPLAVLEIFSCLLDTTRWQPWEYQYIFMTFIFYSGRNNKRLIYKGMLIILVSTYVYSGLHKINGGFLSSVWEGLILKKFFGLSVPTIKTLHLHYAGLLLAVAETALGISLLFAKGKRRPAILLISMHVFLLVLLGPLGININAVIWPWNMAMCAMLYLLFIYKHNGFDGKPLPVTPYITLVLFWGILPMFSFIGYWPSYLSSSLYSGSGTQLKICMENTGTQPQLSPYVLANKPNTQCSGSYKIMVGNWANKELSVPMQYELWYIKMFKKEWQKKYPNKGARFFAYRKAHKEVIEIR